MVPSKRQDSGRRYHVLHVESFSLLNKNKKKSLSGFELLIPPPLATGYYYRKIEELNSLKKSEYRFPAKCLNWIVI